MRKYPENLDAKHKKALSPRNASLIAYALSVRFKPAIRPVPFPLWELNLRNILGPYRWRKLRAAVIKERGLNCEVCGTRVKQSKEIKAHEAWLYTYRGKQGVATVERLSLVCWFCHSCEHFALTQSLVAQGILTKRALKETTAHFCKLNGCTRRQFENYHATTMTEWEELSAKSWIISWGIFTPLIANRKAGNRMTIPYSLLA
jgi:hypothetical protein